MEKYYKNIKTGFYFRLWHKSKNEFKVFKEITKQYFNGLWEIERSEELIGTFDNEKEALESMTIKKIDRGLIIKKNWLNKIFHEGKTWEMRSTKTKVSGRIGLIESGTGLIIGEANLIGSSNTPIEPNDKFFNYHKIKDNELLKKWKYPWILSDIIKYKEPIPYNHPQGAVIWVKLN